MGIKLCDYGCGQEAKHPFKNGKWCCSKYSSQCSEVKNRMSIIKMGSVLSEQTRLKMSITRKGIRPSNDTKRKLSKSKMGKKNPNYGKTLSKEIRRKMSLSHKGEKSSLWKGGYGSRDIPRYDHYNEIISFVDKCRRNKKDKNILEVKCSYCGIWYIPRLTDVNERVRSIRNGIDGCKLYCSNECKQACPIYGQHKYPKDYKVNTSSREVQPELRQMRFEVDNYTCQKCKKHQDELDVALHCHHIEGIRWEPLESADVDKVITLCEDCHLKVHKIEGCGYHDMKCPEEEKAK